MINTEIVAEKDEVYYRKVSNDRRVYIYPILFGRRRIAITDPGYWRSFDDLW